MKVFVARDIQVVEMNEYGEERGEQEPFSHPGSGSMCVAFGYSAAAKLLVEKAHCLKHYSASEQMNPAMCLSIKWGLCT